MPIVFPASSSTTAPVTAGNSTLLQIVQSACAEMGLAVPTQVVGNTDTQVTQLFYLVNALGNELKREWAWENLNKEYRFTTAYTATTGNTTSGSAVITNIPDTSALSINYAAAGTGIPQDNYIYSIDSATQVTLTQACTATGTGVAINFCQTKYDMPEDWDRQINDTHYNKTRRWVMYGPQTAQEWQFLKSYYISTGPSLKYRIMGGQFQIWPPVASNEYLGFEYVSSYWVESAAGAAQAGWQADTDRCIYPDRLMISGLKLKFFSIKGFDTTALGGEFMNQLQRAKEYDKGATKLNMAPPTYAGMLGVSNIAGSAIYTEQH